VNHLQPFSPRKVFTLPIGQSNGWYLKRYGILAKESKYDSSAAVSALDYAIGRLPIAGRLDDSSGNHGVGFQIVHFAEVAVVSPVFYWIWGSVLANTNQMRAQWENTTTFTTGVKEVVGCVWEMEIICFETESWKEKMLGGGDAPDENLSRYLECYLPSAESKV